MAWSHIGGGCWIDPQIAARVESANGAGFCCDDQYQNMRTGKTFRVATTRAAHAKMPKCVASISDLLKRSGVKRYTSPRRVT